MFSFKNIDDYNDVVCRESAEVLSVYNWWKQIQRFNPGCSPHLVDIACRLGSIPASSATAERVWSAFGNIHSKKRNRLTNERVGKLGFIYINMRSKMNDASRKRKRHVMMNAVAVQDEATDEEFSEDSD